MLNLPATIASAVPGAMTPLVSSGVKKASEFIQEKTAQKRMPLKKNHGTKPAIQVAKQVISEVADDIFEDTKPHRIKKNRKIKKQQTELSYKLDFDDSYATNMDKEWEKMERKRLKEERKQEKAMAKFFENSEDDIFADFDDDFANI